MSVTAVIVQRSRVQRSEAGKQCSRNHEAPVNRSRALGPYPQDAEKPGSVVEWHRQTEVSIMLSGRVAVWWAQVPEEIAEVTHGKVVWDKNLERIF